MRNFNAKSAWSRPLADLVDGCIGPALARQGFARADLVTLWPDIVGERIAAYAEPIKLQWPRGTAREDAAGGRVPATLVLRVEGGGALELQHMTATVIERINAHLGWRCVGKLAMRQGPLVGRPARASKPKPPSAEALAAARAATQGIADEALRGALMRLGARLVKSA